jgi:hypothetical protein
MKNGRAKEDIPQIIIQFWSTFEREARERPDGIHSFINYTFLVLKKKSDCIEK